MKTYHKTRMGLAVGKFVLRMPRRWPCFSHNLFLKSHPDAFFSPFVQSHWHPACMQASRSSFVVQVQAFGSQCPMSFPWTTLWYVLFQKCTLNGFFMLQKNFMNGHLLAPLLQQGVVDSSLGGSLAEPSDTNTDRSMQTRATVVSLMVTILGNPSQKNQSHF